MTTQVWFRNPHNYIKELAEVGPPRIVWDRGILVKKRIEPMTHAQLYFGKNADINILCVGAQGTAHLTNERPSMEKPYAVYPTWEYGENFNILEEMVSSPIGLDTEACSAEIPMDERPVLGQPHWVVVTNLPNAQVNANRPFYRNLIELQEEYPECTILLHGSYSARINYGMGFRAVDIEPRTSAANGKVELPNGKVVAYARTVNQLQWINLLGTSVVELKVPRNRCIFNIKSALWAGEHYTEEVRFKSRGTANFDPTTPKAVIPTTSKFKASQSVEKQEGDMVQCDTCSLNDTCKYSREGAVCSVQGSDTSPLAHMFQSRDSGRIIDGLGAVLAAQTNRLEKGMESEDEFGELDPEVTKIMNQVFSNGIKLAKLVDPTLAKPLVQIGSSTAGAVAASNPKELGARVVRALEDQGIKREDITPEMFEGMLRNMVPPVKGELG